MTEIYSPAPWFDEPARSEVDIGEKKLARRAGRTPWNDDGSEPHFEESTHSCRNKGSDIPNESTCGRKTPKRSSSLSREAR